MTKATAGLGGKLIYIPCRKSMLFAGAANRIANPSATEPISRISLMGLRLETACPLMKGPD
jgi:hypothetical protein